MLKLKYALILALGLVLGSLGLVTAAGQWGNDGGPVLIAIPDGITRVVRITKDGMRIGDNTSPVLSLEVAGQAVLRNPVSVVASGGKTLTTDDSNRVYIATAASGTQTFTLPTAATPGLRYTFVAGDAAGEVLVTPAASQTISIKASEGGANVTTAGGTGVKNTAATNIKNDHLTLVSDGVTSWYTESQSGTWASQ